MARRSQRGATINRLCSVTKDEAIKRFAAAGRSDAAAWLQQRRNLVGNNWGWDGWVRRNYLELLDIIWTT
jgi:hypothetical protein